MEVTAFIVERWEVTVFIFEEEVTAFIVVRE